jgi:hypothetical protein
VRFKELCKAGAGAVELLLAVPALAAGFIAMVVRRKETISMMAWRRGTWRDVGTTVLALAAWPMVICLKKLKRTQTLHQFFFLLSKAEGGCVWKVDIDGLHGPCKQNPTPNHNGFARMKELHRRKWWEKVLPVGVCFAFVRKGRRSSGLEEV